MKKKLSLILGTLLIIPFLAGCNDNKNVVLKFEEMEYSIYSGDKVTLKDEPKGVTYSFVDEVPDGVQLEITSGTITYSNIPNYTQVLYTASKDGKFADPVVVTLLSEVVVPTLTIVDTTEYICDGDYIYATSSTNSSIKFALKEKVEGVHIDMSTGMVSFTPAATEGTQFTVLATSNGASAERTFKVAREKLVKAKNNTQATEKDHMSSICFNLDFSEAEITPNVKSVIFEHHIFSEESFTFDASSQKLTINSTALVDLSVGENTLTIVTSKNMVNVKVIIATKIIKNAAELAAINSSREYLSGYFVLGNDIDLSDYLSPTGAGYNQGLGWTPIGLYHDVTDGTAFNDTFKGTFDGNGHVISGYKINRRDEFGFNAGLFGYLYNTAVIKNLGISSDNDNTTASFAGAIAGFNEGKIINCWADVNVSNNYGGNSYRIIGGFVGRNAGTIESCYALGTVQGESQIGAFVGLNEGDIINCYASKDGYSQFCTGLPEKDCYFADSKADLLASAGHYQLDEAVWDLTGDSYPVIKEQFEFYYPYNLTINNIENEFVVGDIVDLSIGIYPESLRSEYVDQVVIKTNDDGLVVDGFAINTANSTRSDVEVTAELNVGGTILKDTFHIFVFRATESIQIVNSFTNNSVEPGERYILSAIVSPEGANQNVRWSLATPVEGISINGNELIIDESVVNSGETSFELVATSSGVSASLVLNIITPKYLTTPMEVIYADDTKDITYAIPSEEDLTNAKMYLKGNEVSFTKEGNTIHVSKDVIKNIPDADLGFRLVLANGDIYRLYACYISHNRYTLANVESDVVYIDSVETFKELFNVSNYRPNRFANNYNKKYVLTADLDFQGQTIYGIGYNDDETGNAYTFSGTIYGMGHKIRNAVITDNEKYLVLDEFDRADNYRSSKYGVGLFGAFDGKVYDLVLENIQVNANSWCGIFAGTISPNAVVENVSLINCTITNASGVDYSTGGLRTGRLTAANEGTVLGCSYNGSIIGLIGG